MSSIETIRLQEQLSVCDEYIEKLLEAVECFRQYLPPDEKLNSYQRCLLRRVEAIKANMEEIKR